MVIKKQTATVMSSKISSFWLGSKISKDYAKFRPHPSQTLADSVINFLTKGPHHALPLTKAVDVGCGTGQSTRMWSPYFKEVLGTDISSTQIDAAKIKCQELRNLEFVVAGYDHLPVEEDSCQLVSCCQAAHWFQLNDFYVEVDRVLAPGGVLALITYNYPKIISDHKLNSISKNFYQQMWDNGCWDERRKLVENAYADVVLPYEEQQILREDENLHCAKSLTVMDFIGYLNTFSAVTTYAKKYGEDARRRIMDELYRELCNALTTSADNPVINIIYPFSLLISRKPLTG